MRDINLKFNNNASVAKQIFDEIAIWQINQNPKEKLDSFVRDLEQLLDKIEEKGYNKALTGKRPDCCGNRWDN